MNKMQDSRCDNHVTNHHEVLKRQVLERSVKTKMEETLRRTPNFPKGLYLIEKFNVLR